MKKIAIVGGGIIGATLANYLDLTKAEVTLFDDDLGQATKASAGIISPWLSKRRNKKWYRLAKDGAAFYPKLVADLALDETIYSVCGTLIFREEGRLADLADFANQRRLETPEMGDIRLLSANETTTLNPLLLPAKSLYLSGGGRLNGRAFLAHALSRAQANGVRRINEHASIKKTESKWLVQSANHQIEVDSVICTAGPACKLLLEANGFTVDVRPQKGQLLSFETSHLQSLSWPVAMLDGEADLIPFENGKIMIGATHENEAGWDLTPTKEAVDQLIKGTKKYLHSDTLKGARLQQLVGTRAYTSDFAPFFGPLPSEPSLFVASGLGSSGLTTGPYIGYLLAQLLNQQSLEIEQYQKPISTYINPIT